MSWLPPVDQNEVKIQRAIQHGFEIGKASAEARAERAEQRCAESDAAYERVFDLLTRAQKHYKARHGVDCGFCQPHPLLDEDVPEYRSELQEAKQRVIESEQAVAVLVRAGEWRGADGTKCLFCGRYREHGAPFRERHGSGCPVRDPAVRRVLGEEVTG